MKLNSLLNVLKKPDDSFKCFDKGIDVINTDIPYETMYIRGFLTIT